MLTVFRIVLPAALTPDTDRGWARAPEGVGVAGGRRPEDGARRPLLDAGTDLLSGGAGAPVLFLDFGMGSVGSAIDGGPFEGLGRLGSAVDMVMG